MVILVDIYRGAESHFNRQYFSVSFPGPSFPRATTEPPSRPALIIANPQQAAAMLFFPSMQKQLQTLLSSRTCLLLVLVTAFLLHEVRSTSEVTGEQDATVRARRSASSGSAAFRTPLGKRITSNLVQELGKRPKDLYSFGIGED